MTSKTIVKLSSSILALCLCGAPAFAHEFWLDPESSMATQGQEISVNMRVGQDFLGQALPYLTNTIAAMIHWSPAGAAPVEARLGDLPAMQGISFDQPGLHRLTLETKPAYIVFDDLAEFGDYLAYEGLQGTVNLHIERGLPDTEIAEEYIRNARALIQVGPAYANQRDTPTGMPFEITALGNPFVEGLTSLKVSLAWQSEPATQMQIAVFHVPSGGEASEDTTRTLLVTDDMGQATIPLHASGSYLLNAVKIDPVDGPGSVVWQSHWASLTFTTKPE